MCRLRTAARGLTILSVCALTLAAFTSRAQAQAIFVNAAAGPRGNGSAEAPYRRITDAVVEARTIRQASQERINIHVARGTYVGSYDATALANHPNFEVLPIILNVPGLTLRGETEFTEDSSGLPTGTETGTETIITSDKALALGQTLLLIAPTLDGMQPHDVAVSGMVLDAQIPPTSNLGGRAIIAERAMNFTIRQNLVRHTFTGITTRLASGVIQGNLFLYSNGNGIGTGGGSRIWPAKAAIRGNRAALNLVGLILGGTPNTFQLQLGANQISVAQLKTTFNRDDPDDLENIPDHLEATVTDNDFSGNSSAGLRCFYLNPQGYTTANGTQPITGSIVATVRTNRLEGNGDYGLVVDAGFPSRLIEPNARQLVATFDGTFSGNIYANNTRGAAFFGFTRLTVSLGTQPRAQFKYLQDSRFTIRDTDGEFVTSFDFDNPAADPFDGTGLRNRLIVNGTAITGTLIH